MKTSCAICMLCAELRCISDDFILILYAGQEIHNFLLMFGAQNNRFYFITWKEKVKGVKSHFSHLSPFQSCVFSQIHGKPIETYG